MEGGSGGGGGGGKRSGVVNPSGEVGGEDEGNIGGPTIARVWCKWLFSNY